jgi:hypothetical protein
MAKFIVADMDEHLLTLYSEELRIVGYDITACNSPWKTSRVFASGEAKPPVTPNMLIIPYLGDH